VKRDPFKKKFTVTPDYPNVTRGEGGEIVVGDKVYDRDVYIRVNGKSKRYKGFPRPVLLVSR